MRLHDGLKLRLEAGGPEVVLRINRRARRISIRIDARSGEAIATAPSERRLKEAVEFARSRRGWIAERQSARPPAHRFAPGGVVILGGRSYRLGAVPGAGAARFADDPDGPLILSGGEGDAFARRVENLLRREARARLEARTRVHERTLGLTPSTVSIMDARSRWGSCTPQNQTIRYSWRVIMAPEAVLDYLAAHEVAHRVHADHSPAYWRVVHGLVGDHRPHRAWFRDHGAALHAVNRG